MNAVVTLLVVWVPEEEPKLRRLAGMVMVLGGTPRPDATVVAKLVETVASKVDVTGSVASGPSAAPPTVAAVWVAENNACTLGVPLTCEVSPPAAR